MTPVSVPPDVSELVLLHELGCTTVTVVAVLLDETGSVGSLPEGEMVALFETDCAVVGAVTVIVIVALPPLLRAPRLHVTVPLAFAQLPCVLVADTKVTAAGRVSTTLALLVIFAKPRFCAVSV